MWKMCHRLIIAAVVIIALVLAFLAVTLKPENLKAVIMVSRFFEVMIPILAVGALLKYLTYCPHESVWNCILPASIIFIAVVIAILAVTLSPDRIDLVILISRFFEVMIPILGVGALLKYLSCCKHSEDKSC